MMSNIINVQTSSHDKQQTTAPKSTSWALCSPIGKYCVDAALDICTSSACQKSSTCMTRQFRSASYSLVVQATHSSKVNWVAEEFHLWQSRSLTTSRGRPEHTSHKLVRALGAADRSIGVVGASALCGGAYCIAIEPAHIAVILGQGWNWATGLFTGSNNPRLGFTCGFNISFPPSCWCCDRASEILPTQLSTRKFQELLLTATLASAWVFG